MLEISSPAHSYVDHITVRIIDVKVGVYSCLDDSEGKPC